MDQERDSVIIEDEEEETTYESEDTENSPGEEVEVSLSELQFINKLLTTKDFSLYSKNHLDISYFPGYTSEIEFLIEHQTKYGQIPDLTTFIDRFPDFDLLDTSESDLAIITALKEEKAYSLIAPSLNEINVAAAKDAIDAAKLMKDKAESILKEITIIKFKPGYDLFKMGHERAQAYYDKLGLDGILGCMSNIPKLDAATHGWLENDFVALTARPQEGKSWIAEYLALQPWMGQRKKICYFSLENSKEIVGYRADTLLNHFSNDALVAGRDVLAWENGLPKLTKEDYADYIEAARSYDTPFLVYDNSDSPTGIWTIEMIDELCDIEKPDFIIIDQLSLLGVSVRTKNIREGYVHTTRYARQMVNRTKRPLLLLCQSGRDSAKTAMKQQDAAPELHQIAESDSVGQDATKVLALKNMGDFLKIALKKNTMGRSNVDVLLRWDIDRGFLAPLALDESDPNPESNF